MTKYKITIEELKDGETYGPDIYQQIVEEIDLTAIIFAVNKIETPLSVEVRDAGRSFQNFEEYMLRNRPKPQSNGVDSIAVERARQIEEEDFTDSYDDCATSGQLAKAAACYALHATRTDAYRAGFGDLNPDKKQANLQNWPWVIDFWKPTTRRRDLVKAGALIAAEIDRLDRMEGGDA